MAYHLGGAVEYSDHREYGAGTLTVSGASPLLDGLPSKLEVWNSHGDRITQIPQGFEVIGITENSAYAAFQHREKLLFGLQFHPEVAHTPLGKDVLENFLYKACGCSPDWTMGSFIEHTCREIRRKVCEDKVVLGLSGGVDSSVAAALIHRAIGDQLTCIFVNNGLLRSRESETVQRIFRGNFHIRLKYVDATQSFLQMLRGVTDPEKKRKLIGGEFIRVFEEATKELKVEESGEGPLPFSRSGNLVSRCDRERFDLRESCGSHQESPQRGRVAGKDELRTP